MKLKARRFAVLVGSVLFFFVGAANAYGQCLIAWNSPENADPTRPTYEATSPRTSPNENRPLYLSATIHCVNSSHQIEYLVENLRLEFGVFPRDGGSLKKSTSSKVVAVSSGVIDDHLLFPLHRFSSISFPEISSLHVFLSVFRI